MFKKSYSCGFLGVLLGPECRTESLRTESISSSPSPVLSSTSLTAGHSKTGSRDSCTQTDKGQSQDSSKSTTPATQSMTLPARLSSPSPVYIPDRFAGQHTPFITHTDGHETAGDNNSAELQQSFGKRLYSIFQALV